MLKGGLQMGKEPGDQRSTGFGGGCVFLPLIPPRNKSRIKSFPAFGRKVNPLDFNESDTRYESRFPLQDSEKNHSDEWLFLPEKCQGAVEVSYTGWLKTAKSFKRRRDQLWANGPSPWPQSDP